MRVGLLESPRSDELRARLGRLQVPIIALDSRQVQELAMDSADLVYLIPFDEMSRRDWNTLRVRLSRASRQFIVAGGSLRSAELMAAVRDGASDVLDASDDDERWRNALARAADSQVLWLQLYGGAPASAEHTLSGESASIRTLRQTIAKLGPTDVSVLILGESGVGKEKVARGLHEASRRKDFVALNCSAIPKDLLEAELFGVEKGAFSGALKSRAGLAEQADRGTLFLDEIGEMDLSLQPKLLRFLETRTTRRVGAEREYESRCRVLAATNRDLNADAKAGRFRSDLYFRLAEISLTIPPLRERRDDIPRLAQIFLRLANERFGKHVESIEPGLLARMQAHPWPGNARELKSVIDRLVLLYEGSVLREGWWEVPDRPTDRDAAGNGQAGSALNPLPNGREKRTMARQLLAESDHNYTWVAGQLGISPTTLWRWRKAGQV